MPIYEYRCTECDELFELRRPASESGEAATCTNGHPAGRRLLSLFAATGRAAAMPAGGGCGAGCACAAAAAATN